MKMAFVIWAVLGIAFIGLGIYCFRSKKKTAFGFWANASTFPVEDSKRYNRTMGLLWVVYGIIFIALGVPLLMEHPLAVMFATLGIMAEAIAVMVVYTTVIEKRFRKPHE